MGILDKVADFGGKVFGNKFAQIIFPGIANANQKLIQTYRQLTYKPQAPNLVQPGLQDKKISTADYGDTIPFVFGRGKVVGQLMGGLTELIEEPRYYEIGGGAVELRYHYRYSGYWLLCRGTATAITRLWLNDDLIFDIRSGTSGAIGANIVEYRTEPDGTIYIKRNTDNIYGPEIYRLRLGTETQSFDPLMAQIYGIDNISAHRGYVGVTIERLFCDPYFKQVPSVTAEVIRAGQLAISQVGSLTLQQFDANPIGVLISLKRMHYDYNNNRVIHEYGPQTSGASGIQYESINVATMTSAWEFGFSFSGLIYLNHQTVVDGVNNLMWIRNSTHLTAYNINTGVQRLQVASTTYHYSSGGLAYIVSKNQLWTVQNDNINILNVQTLLDTGSYSAALIKTFVDPYDALDTCTIHYVQHKHWVILKDHSTAGEIRIYDEDANVIGDFVLSEIQQGPLELLIDLPTNGIWNVENYSVLGVPHTAIWKFDLDSLTSTLIDSWSGTQTFRTVMCSDPHRGAFVTYKVPTKTLEWYDGTGANIKSSAVPTTKTTTPNCILYVPNTGDMFIAWTAAGGNSVELYKYKVDAVSTDDIAISEIIETIAQEVGISLSDMDTSALTGVEVGSFVIDTRAPARNSIDVLQETVLFNTVMQNGKITLKKKNTASIATIDYRDLVIDEENPQRPYRYSLLDEFDKPARYEVRYSDTDADYETGLEYASRTTVISKDVKAVTLPIGLPSTNAKIAAEILLWEQWAQGLAVAIDGTRQHWTINAGDIFTFNDEEGKSRRFLCTKTELIGFTQAAIEAVFNDESAYTVAAQGAGAGWTPPAISPVTNKRAEIMDIPILEDADDYLGFYVVADPGAPSAFLYESVDGGTNYTNKGELTEAAIGYASTALGNHTAGLVWDDVNTVTIVLYSGGTLANATDTQLLAGSNRFLLGQEVIQAGTIVNIATNTYTLSHLLRGRHGTEWAIPFHTVGERFVPVSGDTQRIASTYKGVLNYYKVVRTTQALTDVPPIAFTNAQNGAKPYSPVYIQGSRDGSNNLTITWLRRSRIGTGWGSALEIPLGEQSESYQVDIMQGSLVKRTISVTTPTAAYSAADQTTDFGSVQSAVLVNIYQMSATVGRGTPGIATV